MKTPIAFFAVYIFIISTSVYSQSQELEKRVSDLEDKVDDFESIIPEIGKMRRKFEDVTDKLSQAEAIYFGYGYGFLLIDTPPEQATAKEKAFANYLPSTLYAFAFEFGIVFNDNYSSHFSFVLPQLGNIAGTSQEGGGGEIELDNELLQVQGVMVSYTLATFFFTPRPLLHLGVGRLTGAISLDVQPVNPGENQEPVRTLEINEDMFFISLGNLNKERKFQNFAFFPDFGLFASLSYPIERKSIISLFLTMGLVFVF